MFPSWFAIVSTPCAFILHLSTMEIALAALVRPDGVFRRRRDLGHDAVDELCDECGCRHAPRPGKRPESRGIVNRTTRGERVCLGIELIHVWSITRSPHSPDRWRALRIGLLFREFRSAKTPTRFRGPSKTRNPTRIACLFIVPPEERLLHCIHSRAPCGIAGRFPARIVANSPGRWKGQMQVAATSGRVGGGAPVLFCRIAYCRRGHVHVRIFGIDKQGTEAAGFSPGASTECPGEDTFASSPTND